MGDFALREAFNLLQMAATVGTQYLGIEKTKPNHGAITVNGSPVPII